ncbi:MAG: Secernin [Bacteroidota bacterium]|nr:Secernin [Bacteroidota bacterium]
MCDTFVHIPGGKSSVIFGKNSDREPNEAQQIVRYPKTSREKNTVKTTFIEVEHPQEINEVILSKPFQMWGAEMGVNEYGVAIGNEAVFTKVSFNKKNNGLTGMDLLRLSLEISRSSQEALHHIIFYLEKYGQDACGGYTDKGFYYHNSFIIADKNEAYVLETAGKHWVYQKVIGHRSISNGLTIEENFDGISSHAIEFARKKGWSKKNENFNFRKSYSSWLMPKLSACTIRREQTETACRQHEKFYVEDAFEVLRSHNETPFDPAKGKTDSICMHASGLFTPHQTVGSMVAELRKDGMPTVWLTGSSAPCLSVYKPFYFGNDVLNEENFISPTSTFDNSYWWQWEELHRNILKNYPEKFPLIISDRNELEEEALLEDKHLNTKTQDTNKTNALSQRILQESIEYRNKWLQKITAVENKKHFWYDRFWKKQNRKEKSIFSNKK